MKRQQRGPSRPIVRSRGQPPPAVTFKSDATYYRRPGAACTEARAAARGASVARPPRLARVRLCSSEGVTAGRPASACKAASGQHGGLQRRCVPNPLRLLTQRALLQGSPCPPGSVQPCLPEAAPKIPGCERPWLGETPASGPSDMSLLARHSDAHYPGGAPAAQGGRVLLPAPGYI